MQDIVVITLIGVTLAAAGYWDARLRRLRYQCKAEGHQWAQEGWDLRCRRCGRYS